MRTKFLLLSALLVALSAVAWVRREPTPDAFGVESLSALLARPLDPGPQGASGDAPSSLWKALLTFPTVERAGDALTLRLGRVLTDPSAARLAAEHAGELLALPAEGPDGPLGLTLAQAILAGPATEPGATGPVLSLYGCRHTADADAGPLLEDTYYARLSLAAALRAAAQGGAQALTLRGESVPVKGGVNFEVQLAGEQQVIQVTFDGARHPPLYARRKFRPEAPNDARARANLVQALRRCAAEEGLALTLDGASERVPGGLDLRLELSGRRLGLTVASGSARLKAHLDLAAPDSQP